METDKVLHKYKENYCRIFESIYPSKNSTGFTERNLSVNFAKAYECIHPNAFTWYEFQFGAKNNLHYDAIIINPEQREIIVIEAKRFSQLPKKIVQVACDVKRIDDFATAYFDEFVDRIPDLREYAIIGVILADVWTETPQKIAIKKSFEDSTFHRNYLHNFAEIQNAKIGNGEYFCLDFAGVMVSGIKKDNTIPKNYYLLGMVWNVSKQ